MELFHIDSEHLNTSAKAEPQENKQPKRMWIQMALLFVAILLVKGLLITFANLLLTANLPGCSQGTEPCGREEILEKEILQLRTNLQRIKELFQNVTKDSRCQLCPDRWRWFWGRCYFFSTGLEQDRKWPESAEYCARHNASLAVIHDEAEMEFILEEMRSVPVMPFLWIGLTDSQEEGVWVWQDGTPLHKDGLVEVEWDSENRDCADLRGLGSVFGADCNVYGPWLCEKPMEPANVPHIRSNMPA